MAYSEEQKREVVALLKDGGDLMEVAKDKQIPLEVVVRWPKAAGLLLRRRRPGGGRKPVMVEVGLKVLVDLIEANRRMTQDEFVVAFAERTGETVSKATLAKAMKALGYRKVRLQKAPSEPAPQSPPRYGSQHRLS